MNNFEQVKQLKLLPAILYHLLPGIPILILSVIFSNPHFGFGISIYMSLMLTILFGLIPTQLSILFYHARKEGKKFKEIIDYKESMSIPKTILIAIPFIIFSLAVFILVAPKEHLIWSIFNWIPDWFRINLFDITTVEQSKLPLYFIVALILNGILGPFVEELYFRGFLLPRIEYLGKAAPLVNTILFSIYHFFTPWELITRILAITPFVYCVRYTKNIRIGMIVHLTMNTLSIIGMIVSIL